MEDTLKKARCGRDCGLTRLTKQPCGGQGDGRLAMVCRTIQLQRSTESILLLHGVPTAADYQTASDGPRSIPTADACNARSRSFNGSTVGSLLVQSNSTSRHHSSNSMDLEAVVRTVMDCRLCQKEMGVCVCVSKRGGGWGSPHTHRYNY